MSIKAVIFDADGVLVFPWRFAEHLSGELGITQEATRAFFEGKFTDCLLGTRDLAAVLPPYLAEWGWTGSCEEFMQLWFSVEDAVDARFMGAAQELRGAGVTCCLASNQEEHRSEYMRTVMGFGREFDTLFFSCEIGAKKPDARFYAAVEAALGLSGEQIAFWDDSPRHVDAAKERGWRAELYTDYETFQQQFLGLKQVLELKKTI